MPLAAFGAQNFAGAIEGFVQTGTASRHALTQALAHSVPSAQTTFSMQIRRLTANDANIYQELRLGALRESPTAFSSSFEEETGRSQAQVAHLLSGSPEKIALGAFTENGLGGVVRVGRESASKERHVGWVRSMYVPPANRGRGIGAALLREVLAIAAGWAGLEQLALTVTATNTPAIALYLRSGFIECGRMPRALSVGGSYYDELQMVRFQSST